MKINLALINSHAGGITYCIRWQVIIVKTLLVLICHTLSLFWNFDLEWPPRSEPKSFYIWLHFFLLKSGESLNPYVKNWKSTFENNFFFKARKYFSRLFCQFKISKWIFGWERKICSRFSDRIFHKIDLTTYGLHRDHSPAWDILRRIMFLVSS